MSSISVVFVKDLVERVVVTFVEGWVGAWLVIQTTTSTCCSTR